MSHLDKIDLKILDLEALRQTSEELGGRLILNCQTFDAYNKGQPCLHKIRIPGVKYEVGVRKEKDGSLSLHADFYSYGDNHDGHKITERFGDGLAKFKQTYTVHAAMNAARKQGYLCQRKTLSNGNQQVIMSV